MSMFGPPTQDDIDQTVAAVVEAASPVRAVLFCSVARGQQQRNSDIDLLVVLADGADCKEIEKRLYRLSLPVPVDLVVVSQGELARLKDNIGTIFPRIGREGRELYAAA